MSSPHAEAAARYIRAAVAEILGAHHDDPAILALDMSKTLEDHGMDSLDRVEFVIHLEEEPGRRPDGYCDAARLVAIPDEIADNLTPQPLSAWVDYLAQRLEQQGLVTA
jgi:acyl carrier protein